MQTAWIVWLVLTFAFVIIETSTSALVSIWFCAGSVVALVFSFFFPTVFFGQILVFAIVSVACLLLLRPIAHARVKLPVTPTNADINIGKIAHVITEIQPDQNGRVHVDGLDWSARSDTVLPVGARCRVVALDGVKLVVDPLPDSTSL